MVNENAYVPLEEKLVVSRSILNVRTVIDQLGEHLEVLLHREGKENLPFKMDKLMGDLIGRVVMALAIHEVVIVVLDEPVFFTIHISFNS